MLFKAFNVGSFVAFITYTSSVGSYSFLISFAVTVDSFAYVAIQLQ